MIDLVDLVARAKARVDGRAIAMRSTAALTPDPPDAYGIVPIRVAAEQRIRAVAFGRLDGSAPRIVATWDPLGRDTSFLDPFAEDLAEYVDSNLAGDALPRIWVPYAAALETIEILGERLRTNKAATPLLRRLGTICHGLADEASYSGQQTVAVASELLARHVATGQSPLEDRHLGAVLAWVDPVSGTSPAVEAARRALVPAAAVLPNVPPDRQDDLVERLYRVAKGRGRDATRARRETLVILDRAVRAEWDRLLAARQAFWDLGFGQLSYGQRLVDASLWRLNGSISIGLSPASRATPLARQLDEREFALELAEYVDLIGDPMLRERVRLVGRVVAGSVIRVDQPRRNFSPCTLYLSVTQKVARLHDGLGIRSVDQTWEGTIRGRVSAVTPSTGGAGTLVEVEVSAGFRSTPRIGQTLDWMQQAPFDSPRWRRTVYDRLRSSSSPLVTDVAPPPAVPRSTAAPRLAAVARSLRSRS